MESQAEAVPKPERSLWEQFSDWLGLDLSEPVDLLTEDPATHFETWDRDLPSRHCA